MKLNPFFLFSALLVLGSCSDDDYDNNSFRDDAAITSLNGTWKVISFEDHTTETSETKNQQNSWGEDILISFNDTTTPDEFTGTAIRNSIGGEFEYTGARVLTITEYFTTEVGTPSWGNKFNEALITDVLEYSINSNRLRLYYANKTKSVTLEKQ